MSKEVKKYFQKLIKKLRSLTKNILEKTEEDKKINHVKNSKILIQPRWDMRNR